MKSRLLSLALSVLTLSAMLLAIPAISEAALHASQVGRVLQARRYAPSHPSAGTYSLVLWFDTNNDGGTDQFFHTGPGCEPHASALPTFDQGRLLDAASNGVRLRIDYVPVTNGLTLNCIVGYTVVP